MKLIEIRPTGAFAKFDSYLRMMTDLDVVKSFLS